MIALDSILRKNDDKYIPLVYLGECQYRIKNINKKRTLNKTCDSDTSDNELESGTVSEPDNEI